MRLRLPRFSLSPRRAAMTGGVAVVLAAGAALVADRLMPPDMSRYLDRSVVVADKDGETLRAFTARDGMWRIAQETRDVDGRYLTFLKTFEDKRFDSHWGVDPMAVVRAAGQWVWHGSPVSGASTLTMQTVRLLEPRPRTLFSKMIEALRAFQLEARYSKDQIMAMYLTLAPFGGNIEGVAAASQLYFGKRPAHLTAGEAALLVALPQSPTQLRPDRNEDRARAARDKVLSRLVEAGVLDGEDARVARLEPMPTARHDAPFLSPHLARNLKRDNPGRSLLTTTVDGYLQTEVEALASRHLERLDADETLAVVVMETKSRAVRAYVGSADFMDLRRQGRVDMVHAVRSPGSALKPFIYGLGFDYLSLHPETLVDDRPTRFGDYAPVNFDHRYRGAVTVREALQLSLNVPAVAVLDKLGPDRFFRTLSGAGGGLHLDPRLGKPALPMALGGIGTTLWDMTALYAGLADGGRWLPPRVLADDPVGEPRPMMSETAAWYISRILDDTPPPAVRVAKRFLPHGRRIALKTGTAYGFRDAWAFGFDANYTVGVWVGRPDGTFGSARTGRKRAAPVLYDVFDLLPQPTGAQHPPKGILDLATAQLPAPLRRFNKIDGHAVSVDGPQISFPPTDSVIETDGRDLTLRATGGKRPLTWLIDGKPLSSKPFKRSVRWCPDGDGAHRISVVDRDGQVAVSKVWIRSLNLPL